jgi:hypothetical protein
MPNNLKANHMTVSHDPAFDYHRVTFGYGGGDGVTIAVLGGDTVRVSETHDGGTVGNEYAEVPLAEFLRGLGLETLVQTTEVPREWWE